MLKSSFRVLNKIVTKLSFCILRLCNYCIFVISDGANLCRTRSSSLRGRRTFPLTNSICDQFLDPNVVGKFFFFSRTNINQDLKTKQCQEIYYVSTRESNS